MCSYSAIQSLFSAVHIDMSIGPLAGAWATMDHIAEKKNLTDSSSSRYHLSKAPLVVVWPHEAATATMKK